MTIPNDYAERVYAGVLGKIIGVYLGRPFEGWSYQQVVDKLGEIHYYVNDILGKPLVTTDDDISGTFTFLRALPDHENDITLTPAQIGQTWLNYIIEGKTILWWSGLGNSTEHTAFLRLKSGIQAPQSGSAVLNGKVTSEQIGSQIFIDGWAMVSPGDPALAADLARRAASVSHDGEGIYGAQVLAAMEAQAFIESDLNVLIDTAVEFIPKDSNIYGVIEDVRDWHAKERDWRTARELLEKHHGYEFYGGNVPIVSNHGLIILSLLYGEDDFQKTLTIVNTSGWDTDCNSGNVGCLLGIKNGLAGIDSGPDWRGPIADRLLLPTADGGRAITDAVIEALHIIDIGHALVGERTEWPKCGARFNFSFSGSVQGFQTEIEENNGVEVNLENVIGHSKLGERSLAIKFSTRMKNSSFRVTTPTFILPEERCLGTYQLFASPTLFPGQVVQCGITADGTNEYACDCRLVIATYGEADRLQYIPGPARSILPGSYNEFEWKVEDMDGAPIAKIGLEFSTKNASQGIAYLDYLTWGGAPEVELRRSSVGGEMWKQAWVKAIDFFGSDWPESYRLAQNHGIGLLIQGTREWRDYQVKTTIVPHLSKSVGICAYVQGLQRFYGLILRNDQTAQLVKCREIMTVLAEEGFDWEFEEAYELELGISGTRLKALINGQEIFYVEDQDLPFDGGGVALMCEEGCISSDVIIVNSAKP